MCYLVCSSPTQVTKPSSNETSNDDNSDIVIIAVFITLFVIAVVINILLVGVIVLLVGVIVLLVKRFKQTIASYSPDT